MISWEAASTLILLLHSYMKQLRPALTHSKSRQDAIAVQGLGPLEAGGLTGGVTDGLGGPSFGSPSVGGGVPLDGGGAASFPFEFGGPSVGKPAVGSPFAGSGIFINFLLRVFLETGLSSRDAKRFHSSISSGLCVLANRSHSSPDQYFHRSGLFGFTAASMRSFADGEGHRTSSSVRSKLGWV